MKIKKSGMTYIGLCMWPNQECINGFDQNQLVHKQFNHLPPFYWNYFFQSYYCTHICKNIRTMIICFFSTRLFVFFLFFFYFLLLWGLSEAKPTSRKRIWSRIITKIIHVMLLTKNIIRWWHILNVRLDFKMGCIYLLP